MKNEPQYRYSTLDTVWEYYGFSREEVAAGDFNPKIFNSFTDGTKAAIEVSLVANAAGLDCPDDSLAFTPVELPGSSPRLPADPSGWYSSMWRPFHLIGIETSVSVLSAGLRREPR